MAITSGSDEELGFEAQPRVQRTDIENPDHRLAAPSAPIRTVYEDDLVLVVSKPQGVAVHPAPGAGWNNLVQQLKRRFAASGEPGRHVAAVSRLDRGTSGLVLLAIDPRAHHGLHRQVIHREIRREYQCLVWGRPLFEETVVDIPLGRREDDHRKMAVYVVPSHDLERWGARPARTRLETLERFDGFALLGARLDTGRMHQIRIHCQFLRLPVVGDPWYGGLTPLSSAPVGSELREAIEALPGQCLHAGRLEFRHPATDEALQFDDPLPPPFAALLERLREQRRR